jgi:hypothetical protein
MKHSRGGSARRDSELSARAHGPARDVIHALLDTLEVFPELGQVHVQGLSRPLKVFRSQSPVFQHLLIDRHQ